MLLLKYKYMRVNNDSLSDREYYQWDSECLTNVKKFYLWVMLLQGIGAFSGFKPFLIHKLNSASALCHWQRMKHLSRIQTGCPLTGLSFLSPRILLVPVFHSCVFLLWFQNDFSLATPFHIWILWEGRVKLIWPTWFLLGFIFNKLTSDKEGPIQWRSAEIFRSWTGPKVMKAIFSIFARGLVESLECCLLWCS